MAVTADTVQTFAMVGIREDLSDTISNISPRDTPFYSGIRKGSCKNRNPEWLKDSLANPDPTNAAVEGDTVANDAGSHPTRLKNYVQLFDKVIEVSSTAQAVDAAGRDNELAYQTMKKGLEVKRDIEMALTGNIASVAGNASTAGKLGGVESWLTTNDERGSGGSQGGYNTGTGLTVAATDGTPRAFTETLLKSVLQKVYNAGGDASLIMVTPAHKQTASSFTGIATQYRENSGVKQATILGAAGVYVSDFGELRIVPNRFMGYAAARSATNGLYSAGAPALVLDMSKWSALALQAMKTVPLAKTGHSDRRMIYTELTLKCSDEAANGIVSDLS